MKKIGKLLLCFVPLIGMLVINVGISIVCTIVAEVKYISANGASDIEGLQNWILNLATDKDFLLTTTLIFQACLIVVAAIIYYFVFKEKQIGNPAKKLGGLGFVNVIVLFAAVEFFIGCGLQLASIIFPDAMQAYAEMIEQSGIGDMSTLSTICTLIMAPIGEEIVFRGMTFKLARKFSKNFWVANIIQAVMFGIAHLNLVQGLYAFILGIVLGYAYKKFNSLWATILAHLAFNFCGTYLVGPVFGDGDSNVRFAIVAVISAVVIVLSIIALEKNKLCAVNEAAFAERYTAENAPKAVAAAVQAEAAVEAENVSEEA